LIAGADARQYRGRSKRRSNEDKHVKNLKTLGIAGGLVAAALVGGTLINAALAAPSSPGASGSAADLADGEYCEAWQEAFADELGVSVDDLLPAAKVASIAAIDAAVAAGDLSEERATALKEKIEAAEGNGCRFFGHPFAGIGHGPKAHFGGPLLSVAAEALGMEPGELMQSMRSGDSLEDVATAQGKDYDAVKQAIHDAVKTRLDAAVADGLDQARADEVLSKLDEALAAGEFPGFGPGRGHWGFRGFGDDADESDDATGS
jgi:hypothetical protein